MQEDVDELKRVYTFLYPEKQYQPISYACQEFARINIAGQIYGSRKAKSEKCSVVLVKWPLSREDNTENQIQVGSIKHFIKHKTLINTNGRVIGEVHIFACMQWMKAHPHSNWFRPSAIVCEKPPST